MILGGVAPHIDLINELKGKGYTTILVDYLDNPPAKSSADEFYQVSTLDKEAVLALAKEKEIDLIMTICVDHANITMCYVAEQLGLPLPYTMETALASTDKTLMKARMHEWDVPTSRFVCLSDGEEYSGDLDFPLVVKPADNNGSKGVKKADTMEEVKAYVENAYTLSRSHKVVVEEYNDGKEIQVDCFACDGTAIVLMVKEKLKIPRTKGLAMQSFGSLIPADLPESTFEEIAEIAQKIQKGFGFINTPFFFQANVTSKGVRVIELTPRIGGGLSYKLLKRYTGGNIVEKIYDSYFGKANFDDLNSKKPYMVTNIVYAQDGIFDKVVGIEELIADGTIESFDLMVDKGNEFGSNMDSRNRVGAYYIVAESQEELIEKAQKAYDCIDVISVEGTSIIKRDLYYHK